MLRKSWTLSILVSLLVLTFGLLAVAEQETNSGEPAGIPTEIAPSPQSNVAPAAIVFDLSPGTGAPPPTLGGFAMTPVPFPGAPACTGIPPGTPIPTPVAGSAIAVSPWSGQRCIGSGWATWSHGYKGDVYFTGGPTSQNIKLPTGTKAFYFYVEPDPFADHRFQVVADGVSSPEFTAHGSSGAKYVGVYNKDGTVSAITIRCLTGVAFASGEYGWAGGVAPCPGAIGGKVTDTAGKPLAKAFVLAIKKPNKGFAVTSDTGDYKIPNLPPDTYFVLCFKKGYKFAWAYPVKVECDKVTPLPFKLAPALE